MPAEIVTGRDTENQEGREGRKIGRGILLPYGGGIVTVPAKAIGVGPAASFVRIGEREALDILKRAG